MPKTTNKTIATEPATPEPATTPPPPPSKKAKAASSSSGKKPKETTEAETHADPPPPPTPAAADKPASRGISKKKKKTKTAEDVAEAVVGKTKKTAKKPKAPRAKSAYSLFAADYRAAMPTPAEGAPKPTLAEVSKACGAAWKALEDKSKYEALAADDRARLEAAKPPKRAPSGYILFATAYRATLKEQEPTLTFKELSQRCGVAWKALSEEEKRGYTPVAAA